jgi:hypothetical protein
MKYILYFTLQKTQSRASAFKIAPGDFVEPEGSHPFSFAQTKKNLHKCRFFRRMVREEGFEPSTLWFVARYSIQLSYTRIFTSPKPLTVLLNILLTTELKDKSGESGARGRNRTSDPLVRSQILYPAELHAHISLYFLNLLNE